MERLALETLLKAISDNTNIKILLSGKCICEGSKGNYAPELFECFKDYNVLRIDPTKLLGSLYLQINIYKREED